MTLKTEKHILYSKEVVPALATALGEMVIAFGRLEDVFKVAIKRLEGTRTLQQVISNFSGGAGTLGKLIEYCQKNNFGVLKNACSMATLLNTQRQDFIHATVATSEDGQYVRFRKLDSYTDITQDTASVQTIINGIYAIIDEIDKATNRTREEVVVNVAVSAPPYSTK